MQPLDAHTQASDGHQKALYGHQKPANGDYCIAANTISAYCTDIISLLEMEVKPRFAGMPGCVGQEASGMKCGKITRAAPS